MHRIVVDIDASGGVEAEVLNFAEDVARICSRDGHARADLTPLSRTRDRFVVEVHSASHVRRLIKAIEAVAAKHHLAERVLATDEKYTP
jgi:hypothetical protein